MTWALGKFSRRSDAPSWFISPSGSETEIASGLRFWDAANRWSGGHRAVLHFLFSSLQASPVRRPVTVLDLGCAGGGLARDVARWARKAGRSVRILAVDRNSEFVHAAKARSAGFSEIDFVARGADDRSFLQGQQFDYVLSSGSLHREDAATLPAFIRTADRLARRGWALEDGARDVRLYIPFAAAAWAMGGRSLKEKISADFGRRYTAEEIRAATREMRLTEGAVTGHLLCRTRISEERAFVSAPRLAPIAGLAGT